MQALSVTGPYLYLALAARRCGNCRSDWCKPSWLPVGICRCKLGLFHSCWCYRCLEQQVAIPRCSDFRSCCPVSIVICANACAADNRSITSLNKGCAYAACPSGRVRTSAQQSMMPTSLDMATCIYGKSIYTQPPLRILVLSHWSKFDTGSVTHRHYNLTANCRL